MISLIKSSYKEAIFICTDFLRTNTTRIPVASNQSRLLFVIVVVHVGTIQASKIKYDSPTIEEIDLERNNGIIKLVHCLSNFVRSFYRAKKEKV